MMSGGARACRSAPSQVGDEAGVHLDRGEQRVHFDAPGGQLPRQDLREHLDGSLGGAGHAVDQEHWDRAADYRRDLRRPI